MVDVLCRCYDAQETGANTQESILIASAVKARGIKRLFTMQTSGDARGCEAQPLIVSGLDVAGRTRNVCYIATMANQVWAFDADTGMVLWERTLATPIKVTAEIDAYQINDHIGIMGTPVIDRAASALYCCAWASPDGTWAKGAHYIYALHLTSGDDVTAPVSLEGATFDPGHGLSPIVFSGTERKQRPGLLMTNIGGVKTLFVAFGSLTESSAQSRGWIVALSPSPLQITACWCSTAKGSGGGIWQGGASLTADDAGNIYVQCGNGDFDGVTDFGECFVKLNYRPPSSAGAAGFNVEWFWSPFSDDFRVSPVQTADDPRQLPRPRTPIEGPVNLRRYAHRSLAAIPMSEWGDMDLGSAGPVPIQSLNLLVGSGKDGILYACKLKGQESTDPADLQSPSRSAANYAKLAFPPVFFTYYDPNLSPNPDDIRTLNTLSGGTTHHLHGAPLYWDSPDHGPMLFGWGENGNLRAWSISATGVKYLACGAEVASAQSPVPPGGMPGGMLTLAADGQNPKTGVIFAVIPYGNANMEITNGRLIAYDATQFGTFGNGDPALVKLWDSQDWGVEFLFNKFNRLLVANGKLYVANYSGGVDAYGLA